MSKPRSSLPCYTKAIVLLQGFQRVYFNVGAILTWQVLRAP
jgi:hypothetical protein